jgi:DNA-binding PadR family transcriptional regulator
MNEDMPWVNLTQEEVEELRNKKHELTEYGKQRLKELMNINPTHEEMLDEAARREAENKALAALDELYEKHGDAMLKLAEIEKDNWEQEQREIRVLERYNQFYNTECSGLAHGTPITPEFQQAMTLECMLDALRYENLNHEFDVVSTSDINALIEGLYQQGRDYLERVKNNG